MAKKKQRLKENKVLLEGKRLCEEAMHSRWFEPIELIIDPSRIKEDLCFQRLIQDAESRQIPLYRATSSDFAVFSATEHSPGVACVGRPLSPPLATWMTTASGIWVALDSLRDPGNLGTVLRTAAWFGVAGVLTSPTTVEYTNPKVVRGSMGGMFHLPVFTEVDLFEWLPRFHESGFRISAAAVRGGVVPQQVLPTDRELLLIGSEAFGLDPRLEKEIDQRLTISRIGGGESLNAALAAAIILYEWSKEK
ncbi:MAG TPA: RNA methyltransferase [bacterium]|nr:RNA methyltransferase [bacterium]